MRASKKQKKAKPSKIQLDFQIARAKRAAPIENLKIRPVLLMFLGSSFLIEVSYYLSFYQIYLWELCLSRCFLFSR